MLDFSIYLLYRAVLVLLAVVPVSLVFRLGEMLGWLAWVCAPRYRRLANHNLAIAFGRQKSRAELRRLTRSHFCRLGANLLSGLRLTMMPIEKVAARVTIENAELIEAELRAARPIVIVPTHLGNWEVSAQLFPYRFPSARSSNVYQPLRNRHIDADIRRRRERAGLSLVERREGFHGLIELLRAGGVVGVLSDQHAGDQGLWTPFFGQLASTSSLPALLAKRSGANVFAAAVFTDGVARWRLVFTPIGGASDDSPQLLTSKVNDVIARQIAASPADWFWVHNRWKTPKPNFLLAEYKRGTYLPPGMSPAELQPFRILIRGTNWLGDSVISAAAVRAIKRGRPDAHITVAAPEKLAAVWKLVPEVAEVLSIPDRSLFGTVRRLRKQNAFDVAILFPNSLRSALEVWLAGVPRRVGYRGHRRSWFLNQVVPPIERKGPLQHQVNDYLHIAKEVGANIEMSNEPAPAQPRNATTSALKLGLCPGAEYGPAKRWLPERFAEAAEKVAAQVPATWTLFGTAADAEVGRTIAAKLGDRCVNRIGETTLEQLIAELRECRLLLTNDTGTMHLATLLGVPVVAIFGSTEHRLTGPLGMGNTVVRHHVECSPCFLRECPIDFRCMHAVKSTEVSATILSMLANSARAA